VCFLPTFRRLCFTVFFLFVFEKAPMTLLLIFEAMLPARRSVMALLRRALRRRLEYPPDLESFLRFFSADFFVREDPK
jgi:hypothetical protein